MSIDFQMRGFCSHCKSTSIQQYINHHVYDEEQGGLWNGDPESIKQPASYFIFSCHTCEHILLYHFYPQEDEVEDILSFYESGGVKRLAIDGDELLDGLELMYPALFEDIHTYIPSTVRKQYLRALKSIDSPNAFATELRIALEILCDESGISRNDYEGRPVDLNRRIGELGAVAKLPSTVKDVAHKIRIAANDVLHNGKDIDPSEVPLLQNFFRVLINHVFVLPLQKQDWANFNPQ